ncbi:MAG TPA: hypothetical protein PK413_04050 [Thermoanaerobaculia bacterium]|nr:hypothetical protein [Thermoanaerobaculia bacterium]
MRSKSERGEGNVGCLIWLVILAAVGLILWKAVPVKVATTELYDYMVELTRFAPNRSTEDLKKAVLKKAKELDLPLDAKNITVEKDPSRIRFTVKYTVPLEFPGYTYLWEVNEVVDRPIFYL